MALFRKNPAEKKLKELTGGLFLSSEFKERLEREGLSLADGFEIQSQLKEDIKTKKVTEEGLETRMNYLINQKKSSLKSRSNGNQGVGKSKSKARSKPSSKTRGFGGIKVEGDGSNDVQVLSASSLEEMSKDDKVKEIKFLINQEHNVEKCLKCGATVLRWDKYCHKCGSDLVKSRTMSFGDLDEDAEPVEATVNKSVESTISKPADEPVEATVNKSVEKTGGKPAEEATETVINKPVEAAISKPEEATETVINKPIEVETSLNKIAEEEKSTKDELSELEALYSKTTEKSTKDELSELEHLYNKKLSNKYDPKFKFASVLYLDQIDRNPTKKIPNDKYTPLYNTTVRKVKKQVLNDGLLEEGNPLAVAKSAKVNDLKSVLKKYDLKVSGKKEDLIERLWENLSEEELKEAFPKKLLSVTDKGFEFIEENRHVFYFDKASPLRTHIDPEDYDSVFDEADDLSDENIYRLLIEFLRKREKDLANNKEWAKYRYNFMALARVCKDSGDDYGLLDADFKLFIAGINNFSDYTNESEPFRGYIGKTYSDELISLLHSLSLEIDELKAKFNESYDDLRYPELKISKEESLVYLLKIFSGTDIEELTSEIHSKYPDPNFSY